MSGGYADWASVLQCGGDQSEQCGHNYGHCMGYIAPNLQMMTLILLSLRTLQLLGSRLCIEEAGCVSRAMHSAHEFRLPGCCALLVGLPIAHQKQQGGLDYHQDVKPGGLSIHAAQMPAGNSTSSTWRCLGHGGLEAWGII